MLTQKIQIKTEDGNEVEALAPVIISASRSTDIPAFHSDWFLNRLKAKYCIWTNPFNQKRLYISFKNTRAIVFWTKNPRPLMDRLDELDKLGIPYYFQYTLNDYTQENFEPNLKSLDKRIDDFIALSKRIGAGRVVWRFDPIILAPSITPRDILMRIWNIGNKLKPYTKKLVFSFVDVAAYRKVQNNLKKNELFSGSDIFQAEANTSQITEICEGLIKIRNRWIEQGFDIKMATCCENVDLSRFDIEQNRCIDDVLLRNEFPNDTKLIDFLNYKIESPLQNDLFSASPSIPIYEHNKNLKDKGQRKSCGCIASKDIGSYNTCAHFCTYCYANTSVEVVKKNLKKINANSPSLLPIE